MKKLMFVMFAMVAMMTACETKNAAPAPTTTDSTVVATDSNVVDSTVIDSTVVDSTVTVE